jgi:hypothetical protein
MRAACIRWARTVVLLAAGAGLAATGALSQRAEGFTGTPAAKQLVRQMLDSYKHVRFLSVKISGDVVYCPQFHTGYIVGSPDPRHPSCTARATVTHVDELSHGLEKLRVGSVMAPGKPTLTFVGDASSSEVFDPSRGCWKKQGSAFDKGAPFIFPRQERLTITGRTGNDTVLKGVIPHFAVETDRINARTHEVDSVRIRTLAPPSNTTFRYRTVRHAPAVRAATPACS